jgi:molybdate/tungstate transport system ATP-binding protein
MNSLTSIENLSLRLGRFALRRIDLSVAAGEILVLLGPNGAGKSVTLETIAGFHRPNTGRIVIAGRDVTHLPPERRRVGLVFQNFALFPHLTVAQNVEIAAGRSGTTPRANPAVPLGDPDALLSYFSIAHLANRRPQHLSAGEKQRTGLARAFAARPELLLFDEPFSSLDAPTHELLRRDLGAFVRAAAIPAIFVTHDPVDAQALADRVALITDGTLLQHGSAAEVFERPVSGGVARLVGWENVLNGEVESSDGKKVGVRVGGAVVEARMPTGGKRGQQVAVCIKAEDVRLHREESTPRDDAGLANRYRGRVVALTNFGPLTSVALDCSFALRSYVMTGQLSRTGISVGDDVIIGIEPRAVHLALRG